MARAAIMREDVAENIIEADEGYEPPEEFTLRWLADAEFVGPGWRLTDDGWRSPEQPDVIEPAPDPVAQMRDDLDWLINFVVTGEA